MFQEVADEGVEDDEGDDSHQQQGEILQIHGIYNIMVQHLQCLSEGQMQYHAAIQRSI